jgi:hypothetical protein
MRQPLPRLAFPHIFSNFGFGWTAGPANDTPLRCSLTAPSLPNGGKEPAADVQPGVRGTSSRSCSSSRPRSLRAYLRRGRRRHVGFVAVMVPDDGCTTCAGRRGDEKAGRVHELHDEERDDGDGNGDVGLVG